MVIHKLSTDKGTFTLCNQFGKTISKRDFEDVTCKKCLKLK